jgi:hypothetical protein
VFRFRSSPCGRYSGLGLAIDGEIKGNAPNEAILQDETHERFGVHSLDMRLLNSLCHNQE